MTEKQKIQLSDTRLCALLSLALLLGLFLYSLIADHSFFIILIIANFIIIVALLAARQHSLAAHAQADLQRQDLIERANLLASELEQERSVVESFQKKIVSYSHLKDLTEKVSLCLSLADTSRTLCAEVNALFEAEGATTILYLFNTKTGELGLSSSYKGRVPVNIKSKKGDIFDQWVVKTMQPLVVEDTQSDFRFDTEKVQIETEDARDIRSLISAPLTAGNKALGILRVDGSRAASFTTEDLRFLSTIADVGAVAIENAELYERVEELAIKDGLTGLYLRRYLLARMNEEISRQLRKQQPLSLLMLDLDRFKNYNDKFGHMAGDIVLKTVSMILQATFQDSGDLVSRYGGEEFVVLLPDCPKEDAVARAEELCKKIKKHDIILRQQKTHITVSIGVATFPTDAQIKDDLIVAADNALYKAKSEGRDRVCSL